MPVRQIISVVDDDEPAREAIGALIRAFGFLAIGFESAAAFLKSPDLQRTMCLLADVRMPGMSGLELYLFLVASGTPVPTILITAYPDELTRARAEQAGVVAYLTKPCHPAQLLECIRSALRGATSQPQEEPKR